MLLKSRRDFFFLSAQNGHCLRSVIPQELCWAGSLNKVHTLVLLKQKQKLKDTSF